MADEESKSWTFLKGVGGVAAAVLTAVLIYYFTRPTPSPVPVPVVTSTSSVELDGFVADYATRKLLPKASVTVSLGSDKIQQYTDASGRYSVVFNTENASAAMGSVATSADGYQSFSNTVPLKPGTNFAEIDLDAVPPPVQPATPGVTVQPAFVPSHAAITLKPKPFDFKAAVTKYAKHP